MKCNLSYKHMKPEKGQGVSGYVLSFSSLISKKSLHLYLKLGKPDLFQNQLDFWNRTSQHYKTHSNPTHTYTFYHFLFPHNLLFQFVIIFQRTEREEKMERVRGRESSPMHRFISNCCNSQSQAIQEPETPSVSPMWLAGARVLGPSCTAYQMPTRKRRQDVNWTSDIGRRVAQVASKTSCATTPAPLFRFLLSYSLYFFTIFTFSHCWMLIVLRETWDPSSLHQ